MKILKKILFLLINIAFLLSGAMIAPLLGVNALSGAAISLFGCSMYILGVWLSSISITILKNKANG